MTDALLSLASKLLPSFAYQRLIGEWSEKGFRRYFNNTGWALLARIVSIAVSFFVTIYLVRYLGPEHYGNLSYAVSFVGLFSIIGSLGIDTVLYRELVQYPDKRNYYLGSALGIKLAGGFLAGVLTIAAGLLLATDDVSRLIILLLAATFIFNAFNVISYEFQANVEQKYPSLVSLAVVLILNILKLVVIFLNEGILYIAVILLLESVLYACLYVYIRTRRYGSLRSWRFDPPTARTILLHSWPFIFIAAFASLYTRIDQVMLKHLMDASAVGLYDAAVRVAEAWMFVPAIVASSLFPAILNAKKTGSHEYKKRLVALVATLAMLAVAIALPASLLATPLMTLLYGPAFAASAGVFSIYVWAGLWGSIAVVTDYFLVAEYRQKTIFFVSVGTATLNIILNLLLIPPFGILGAAWATFISYAALALPFLLILRTK